MKCHLALPSAHVPDLACLIAACGDKQLLSWSKRNVPNTALMALKRADELQVFGLPDVDRLVLRGSGDQLVIRSHSHRVDVLLMGHDRHLS